MTRIVHFACARCGHPEMHVVESAGDSEAVAENVGASGDHAKAEHDMSTSDALRLRRLESLPTSLPVGGIITPV